MTDEITNELLTEEPTTVIPQESVHDDADAARDLEAEQLTADMMQAGLVANKLVQAHPEYGRLLASMLASRQLYTMCLYELERLADETDFKAIEIEDETYEGLKPNQMVMLSEILINAAAVQSQQSFDEQMLFNGMTSIVFPWMQEVVKKHTLIQKKLRRETFNKQEAERVATPLSLGIPIFPPDETTTGYTIQRHKPLMLIGWEPAVRWLLDHITGESMKYGSNVEQMLRLHSGGAPGHNDPRIWYVPKLEWGSITSTNTAFQQLYSRNIESNLINPVDVMLVDDLTHAYKGLSFGSVHSVANEAQKKLKKWAEVAGCLLIGCVILPRHLKANELNTTEFETLRMHNVLRSVCAETIQVEGSEWYKVMLGAYEVDRFPKETLDKYISSVIIQF